MVKQIIWTLEAKSNKKEILLYWNNRNKSKAYSKKLNLLFKEAIRLISDFPEIGRPTNIENVRIKVVKDYLIIYETTPVCIYVLTIFDGRRDPEILRRVLQ